jgi:hypothetical protein
VIDHFPSIVCSSWQRQDPRVSQVAVLAGLFGYEAVWLDFAVSGMQTVVLLAVVLLTQALCSWLWKFPTSDRRSALISGLSLGLLLYTHTLPPRHAVGIPHVGYLHVACTT